VLSRVAVYSAYGYNNQKASALLKQRIPTFRGITLTSESDPDFTEKNKKANWTNLVDVIEVSDLSGQAFIQRE